MTDRERPFFFGFFGQSEQPAVVKKEANPRDRKKGREKCVKMNAAALSVVMGLGTLGAGLYAIRPRDPIFEVVSINLKGFKLNTKKLLVVIDVELVLCIKVINPNVTPIEYTSTIMDIYYRGDLLGQAKVAAGQQEAKSTQVIEVPAKLDGLELTNHLKDLFADVAKREMTMTSIVTIKGVARVWKWAHSFEVHVTSDIKVDPIFLDVLEQDNRVKMELEPVV